MSTPVIRVVLADDQALVRAGFLALLDAQDDIEVVGEAADGDEAVARDPPRRGPTWCSWTSACRAWTASRPPGRIGADPALDAVRVVILTTFELDEYVFEALRAGASGFLVKDTEPAELLRAVRAVAAGDALLSPSVTRRLIEAFASDGQRADARHRRPRPAHQPRTRGDGPGRGRLEQRRDRRAALREHRDGEDAREPGDDEARRPRPRPARGARLRVGLGAGRPQRSSDAALRDRVAASSASSAAAA